MADRLHSMQHLNRLFKLKIERLQTKVTKAMENHSVCLDSDTSKDMEEIMSNDYKNLSSFRYVCRILGPHGYTFRPAAKLLACPMVGKFPS